MPIPALASDGKPSYSPATGKPAYDCGDYTCDGCWYCCFSSASLADVTWPELTRVAGESEDCTFNLNGGSITDLPRIATSLVIDDADCNEKWIQAKGVTCPGDTCMMWGKRVGNIYYQLDKICEDTSDWQFRAFDTDNFELYECNSSSTPSGYQGCCGDVLQVFGIVQIWLACDEFDAECAFMHPQLIDPPPPEMTVAIKNNKCCSCAVDEVPTCIKSDKDYAEDCLTEGGLNECNQLTGSESVCEECSTVCDVFADPPCNTSNPTATMDDPGVGEFAGGSVVMTHQGDLDWTGVVGNLDGPATEISIQCVNGLWVASIIDFSGNCNGSAVACFKCGSGHPVGSVIITIQGPGDCEGGQATVVFT